MSEAPPPRVFISYSHDSREHEDRVLALANRLRAEKSIDARIDRYVQSPPEGWPLWCEREIYRADFVLVVCTQTYLRRVNYEEEPGAGHGVLWEAHLIRQHLYDAGTVTNKFVPILLADADANVIPTPVKGRSHFRPETPDGFASLCGLLKGQPAIRPPELGSGWIAERQTQPGGPISDAPPAAGSAPLGHPNWAKSLWPKPQYCRFHIATSRYARKRRWNKYADILVEVVEPVLDDMTGEAYLFPSVAARPVLRDAGHLNSAAGRELLRQKKSVSAEFIARSGNRLLEGCFFAMTMKSGDTEIGIYCADYDAFLNEKIRDPD
ncbi:MAG: SEFIR domain-containing protein [Alphaproteobacteria bacterium]